MLINYNKCFHVILIIYFISIQDFKQFLEDEKVVWSRKLEEIEKQFLSTEQNLQLPSAPPQKKTRKRKGAQKADPSKEENFEMARLAALLQISHFQQVLCCITQSTGL